jgi:hypothetical protein
MKPPQMIDVGCGHAIRSVMGRFFLVLMLAAALTGCGRNESYRYKLTLAVNTPDGIRRASSVVEVVFWDVSIPDRGVMHKLYGEALYLDLGPRARPMIALLTSYLHPKHSEDYPNYIAFENSIRWTRDAGPGHNILAELYGRPSPDFLDNVARISRMRGPHKIAPSDLPDLVTFRDVGDPKSVVLIDPNNLQAILGSDITWHEMTLEMTDEPITTGITTKLTWLPTYADTNLKLDGSKYEDKSAIANRLSSFEFYQPSSWTRIW